VLPAVYWTAGTGGSYARLRAFFINPGDGMRYNLVYARADIIECFYENYPGDLDGAPNSFNYVAANCFSHRPEARVYTSGFREGAATCAAPAAGLAKTNGHYMLTQIPACAQKIVYDRMAEKVSRGLIDDHYRINHSDASLAHRKDNVGSCSEQAGGNCTLGGFFGAHERYIRDVERHVMVYDYPWMPVGKIPAWSSSTTIPADFTGTTYGWRTAVAGPANCNSRGCSNGWESNPITNPTPNLPLPAQLSPIDDGDAGTTPEVCELATPAALHGSGDPTRTQAWHNLVHPTAGGSFGSFDSPAFPLFFLWHNYVEDVWLNWKACPGNGFEPNG